eukprot:6256-Heterococcus_DN1.PRE.4
MALRVALLFQRRFCQSTQCVLFCADHAVCWLHARLLQCYKLSVGILRSLEAELSDRANVSGSGHSTGCTDEPSQHSKHHDQVSLTITNTAIQLRRWVAEGLIHCKACAVNATVPSTWKAAFAINSGHTAHAELSDVILDRVFGYVGRGDHLHVAGVCRNWRGRYMQLKACSFSEARLLSGVRTGTRHRSALMSLSRLQCAKACGLKVTTINLTKDAYAEAVCQQSPEPLAVVTELRLHGSTWSETLCSHAAFNSELQLLIWLRNYGCPWNEESVLVNASSSGSVQLLEWLRTATVVWSEEMQTQMLNQADHFGRMEAAQWLRSCGARWPERFTTAVQFGAKSDDAASRILTSCWTLPLVQWAIASGAEWLTWRCEDYHVQNTQTIWYYSKSQTATAVLNLAHANGCPCTCGHQQQQQPE